FIGRGPGNQELFRRRAIELQLQIGVGDGVLAEGVFRGGCIGFPFFLEEQWDASRSAASCRCGCSGSLCAASTASGAASPAAPSATTPSRGRGRVLSKQRAGDPHKNRTPNGRNNESGTGHNASLPIFVWMRASIIAAHGSRKPTSFSLPIRLATLR